MRFKAPLQGLNGSEDNGSVNPANRGKDMSPLFMETGYDLSSPGSVSAGESNTPGSASRRSGCVLSISPLFSSPLPAEVEPEQQRGSVLHRPLAEDLHMSAR
ncbi:hypothetical protein KUCAC02_000164 [Chaenocephalus aceratus]|uniref:Uncharacterized protein n=1 Tax=Chaenocephalus aceratus TaxID=36190 RepID=A0ACB9W675_CHAAC|nr:hypothetical protein KUCAC02_000164 [Chaenocephalus aceratus]